MKKYKGVNIFLSILFFVGALNNAIMWWYIYPTNNFVLISWMLIFSVPLLVLLSCIFAIAIKSKRVDNYLAKAFD